MAKLALVTTGRGYGSSSKAATVTIRSNANEIIGRAARYFPEEIRAAHISTANRIGRQIITRSSRFIARAARVKVKTIRTRIGIARATRRRAQTAVYFRYRGIPVEATGTVKELQKGGIKVGRNTYPRAFYARRRTGGGRTTRGRRRSKKELARMGHGSKAVFERRGKARLPIDRVQIPLDRYREWFLNNARTFTLRNYDARFYRELNWRLEKRKVR